MLDEGGSVTLRSAADPSRLCLVSPRTLQGETQAGAVQFIEGDAPSSFVQIETMQGSPSSFVGTLDFASGQCPAWSTSAAQDCPDAGLVSDGRVRDAQARDVSTGDPWLIGAVQDGRVSGADVAFCRDTVDMNDLSCGGSGSRCDPAQFSTPPLASGATRLTLVDGVEGPKSAYAFSATEAQRLSEGPAWTFFQPGIPEDFAFRALIKRPDASRVGTAQDPLCFLRLGFRDDRTEGTGYLFLCFEKVGELGGTLSVRATDGTQVQNNVASSTYSCFSSAEWGCLSIVFDDYASGGPVLNIRYAGESLRPDLGDSPKNLVSAAISAWGDGSRSVVVDQLYWTDDDDMLYACGD